MKSKKLKALAVLAVVGPLALAGCSQQAKSPEGGGGEGGKTQMTMWTHSAGNEGEMKVIAQMIEDFNGSQENYEVVRQDFPQAAYNDSVQGAAASGDLPCILDVDGPIMPNWAWNGWLVPSGLTDADVENFLPSTVGRYDGQIYSVGYWDATTLIFTRSSILEKVGARVPTVEQPWTAEEFADIQKKLKDTGDYEYVIDWGPGWADEWWPYAYAPLMQSFGGDLIDRNTFESADGVLNGAESVKFAEWFQAQFADGYAPKSNAQDRTEFKEGKVALQYNGVWALSENSEVYDDLLMIPAPDFGAGSKAGVGSWQYSLTNSCSDAQKTGALEYLKFTMDDKYIAQFSDVTSLIPATTTAWEQTEKGFFGPDKPAQIAATITEANGLVRPPTPAYPVISRIFDKALRDIVNGSDPKGTLDQAVSEVDTDIKSAGYNK
ncbi:MAG: extracellular solute-binding protein [Propionibacteriaceae bacterium]|nr:extracellular solute-binding protein [Propionibacteriaceae bacterium]